MARIAIIGLVGKSMFFDVPRFHSGGETITAKSLYEEWGGKGFNQAVAAARQDAAVMFLGAVNASDAKPLKDFCAKEGIRATLAAKKKPTACAAILTDGTGETRVTVYPGAELEPRDVDGFAGAIATADVLLLNNEVPEAVNLAAVELAVKYDVQVVYNPAPARKLPKAIISAVSVFTPNEFEEESLFGDLPCREWPCRSGEVGRGMKREWPCRSGEVGRGMKREWPCRSVEVEREMGREWPCRSGEVEREMGREWPCRSVENEEGVAGFEVVTTLGARGCRIRSTGEVVPAPPAKAVDTTGAGDTFTAVLAVRLAEGDKLRDACIAANEAAAQSVAVKYVMPSLPTRSK